MPLKKLEFRPGLNREGTDYANEGGWYDGNKIRFRSGFPEKIGGWVRVANNNFLGIARALCNWIDLGGSNYLGVGTNWKYYIEYGSAFYDITPIRSIVDPVTADPFSTAFSTLNAELTVDAITLVLTSGASFPDSLGVLKIDSELIFYTSKTGDTLSGLIRGYQGTTPAVHYIGADVASSIITVHNPAHGAIQNDFVTYDGATGVDAFTAAQINIEHQVYAVIDSNYYTINMATTAHLELSVAFNDPLIYVDNYLGFASTGVIRINDELIAYTSFVNNTFSGLTRGYGGTIAASHTIGAIVSNELYSTSAATNGGAVTIATYQITTGLNVYTLGTGWGTGTWGRGGWGTAFSAGIGQQLRLWTNDNFGADLVLAPRGGEIYYWEDALGINVKAVSLSYLATFKGFDGNYVPVATNQVVTSAIQKFVIAFGANSYIPGDPATPFNPMLVRWSDQLNPFQWIPDITNQSGEFALTNGSFIIGARATRQEILIWTDSALYSMQYIGTPYVWGFNILLDNTSIMSPNAMVTANNVTYWMGTDKFYMYSGRVETLPCSLRQYVFDDLNNDQAYQVFSGSNEGYNEVWWFYVSNSSQGTDIDKYVIYNYLDRVWYYGSMSRTAWLDTGTRKYPIAASYNNRVLYHEASVDDVAGITPEPINAYVQSSDFDIGDGHNFGFVWRILPDVNFNGSNVNQPSVTMTVKPRQNSGTPYGVANSPTVTSNDNFATKNVYNIQEFTGQVYTRLRGRQLSFRIESTGLGVSWQLGMPRIDIRSDGRR